MPYDTHRWPTGDTYAGEWTSDMRQMHGRGIYTNAAGRYEGEYSYGKRHGRGVFVESTGARYDGEHVNGHKCGQGTVIMAGQLRGHEYRGEFRNGAPHGRGSFKWPDGSVFTGQHERSCPTQGVLVEANGRQYDVTYASDCGIFWNSLCKALPSEMIGTYPDPQASGNDHRAVGPPPTPRTKNPTQEQHRKDNQQERDLQERQRQQHEQEESVQRARAQQARRERERQQREQEEGGRRAREAERREREESERLEREQRAREDAEQDISKRLLGDGPPVEVPTELVMRWTNNFSDERKIGEGAFGDVFEGILADSLNQRQARVAVKRLKPEIRLQGDEEEQRAAVSCIRREIHVLSSFHHPNIIRLLGHTSTSVGVAQELCLVYELGYASLDKMLTDDEKAHDLTCRVRIRIAADISRALNYLHSHDPRGPAFHRDVKSANVVLTLALRPKLIDCGLSKFVPDQNSRGTIMSTRGASIGTPGYMCTTYLRTHKFDAKSENFSYGIVLLELLLGRVQGLGEDDLYGIYIEEETPISNDLDMRAGLWIPECAEQLENLARECLSKYSKRIATMMAVMRRLIELEKEFCSATAEELRLTRLAVEMQRELETLRFEAATQADAHEGKQQACCICYDDAPISAGIGCERSADHFICANCAPREVQRILEAIQEAEPLARHRAQGGRILCVQKDCNAPYAESALARVLPDGLFREYRAAQDAVVEQRFFEELQQRFQEQLEAARREFENANDVARAEQGAAATAEFMRRQYPNAVQCPRCRAGPVIPENCYDLQAHHGESSSSGRGRISNACPSCRFFSRERGDWVRWDGQMRGSSNQ